MLYAAAAADVGPAALAVLLLEGVWIAGGDFWRAVWARKTAKKLAKNGRFVVGMVLVVLPTTGGADRSGRRG